MIAGMMNDRSHHTTLYPLHPSLLLAGLPCCIHLWLIGRGNRNHVLYDGSHYDPTEKVGGNEEHLKFRIQYCIKIRPVLAKD
ncbi:hypothetical protein BHE74_00053849 [Ensete ventricosum]|nr:hypothetical protein BHE74_00053849 [Ensete ventricosum]RZS25085.1 hypothetical protein BHM03_00058237 [Ensete ventricosum]